MVWAAPWHYEARGADRIGSMAGKAGGGSQWRGEAELQGSFSWKWINVTLPRVRVRTGTAASRKGSLWTLQFLRTGSSYISKGPEVPLEVTGYGPADHPGVQVSSISIRQRIEPPLRVFCVSVSNSGSLMAYRLLQGGQTQHGACGTVWTTSILSLFFFLRSTLTYARTHNG